RPAQVRRRCAAWRSLSESLPRSIWRGPGWEGDHQATNPLPSPPPVYRRRGNSALRLGRILGVMMMALVAGGCPSQGTPPQANPSGKPIKDHHALVTNNPLHPAQPPADAPEAV